MVGSGARFIDDKTGAPVMHTRRARSRADPQGDVFQQLLRPSDLAVAQRGDGAPGALFAGLPGRRGLRVVRRIASQVVLANVGDFLLDYRISSGGISVSKRRRQLLDRLRIQFRYLDATEWRCWPAW